MRPSDTKYYNGYALECLIYSYTVYGSVGKQKSLKEGKEKLRERSELEHAAGTRTLSCEENVRKIIIRPTDANFIALSGKMWTDGEDRGVGQKNVTLIFSTSAEIFSFSFSLFLSLSLSHHDTKDHSLFLRFQVNKQAVFCRTTVPHLNREQFNFRSTTPRRRT